MDDNWEDLDDSAVEECMVLATQMFSELPQEECSSNQKVDESHETAGQNFTNSITIQTNSDAQNPVNKRPRLVEPPHNNAASNLDDSGFISVQSNSLNTANSRLPSKNTRTVCNQPSSLPKNSYSNRFNDFAIPSNNSHKSSSGTLKPVHGSGKVYNSIPMKGAGGTVNSGKGCIQPSCLSGRAVNEDNKELLRRIQIEKSKLEEDVLLKQGEISLLRAELKRKEAALETERLDRCAAIEAAEKRGKEKVANVAAEAETRTKESVRSVEKLEGELLFKNREIEELIRRCHKLEQQTKQHVPSQLHGSLVKRCHSEVLSPKVSPSKLHSNFTSRFDFGGSRVSVRSVEIQTESYSKTKVRRQLIAAAAAGGHKCGSRRAAYLLSAIGSAPSIEGQATSYAAKQWSLPCEWSYLTSQIIIQNGNVEVEKRVMTLAIERLQEVHTLVSSKEIEDNRSPVTRPISPLEWYEGQVVPALHVIRSFVSPHNITEESKILQIISAHLSPLYIKEVLVNNRICCIILETMEKIASFVSSPKDKIICEQVIASLIDCFANINTDREHLLVLKALVGVAGHASLTSLMCTTAGSCLVGKLCSTIDKICIREVTTVSELLKWVMVLVEDPPPWLQSNCICPSQLLATLLKQVYQALHYTHSERRYEKTVYRLLLSSVRVLHRWSTVDPEWWEKVAHLPHYTALMGTIITSAKDIQPDRQTVDLLCDLYEVDEGTFDGY
ncbi:uncharacterized protein [Procambarus clarkii]|uniref:uncharacterized protein n=1 Tax=Procambarus clarkii TaxID=6728 RepID=UPI0037420DE3